MIDSQLVCPRGGHGPSSVVDSTVVKALRLDDGRGGRDAPCTGPQPRVLQLGIDHLTLVMTMLPCSSSEAALPGGTSVVELCSSITTGPANELSPGSRSRSRTGVSCSTPAKTICRVPSCASSPVAGSLEGPTAVAIRPSAASLRFTNSTGAPGVECP